jgi:uncharacterized protein
METMHKQTGGDNFCMHGGECTVTNRGDFETILKKMYELQGKSALQTNCFNIDNDLIRLFKKYKTSVGVSIDGDGELNALRGFPDDKKKNRDYTNQVLQNMFRLQEEGVSVGVITILHKANADSLVKLKKLVKFILTLRDHGIKGGRLNLMWTNYPEVKQYELSPEEACKAWIYLYINLKSYPDLQWQPFREFVDNLLGFSQSCCSYGKCDYFCTYGAKVILPDGSLGNCDRTHQEGCLYTRSSNQPSYERYDVLKEAGCSNCKFWNVCYGGCPAEGLNGDWRNKTRWCSPIYNLYSLIEADVKAMFPNIKLVTDHTEINDYFDMVNAGKRIKPFEWAEAKQPSSWKYVNPRNPEKVNIAHGDVAHGDFTNHGDSAHE